MAKLLDKFDTVLALDLANPGIANVANTEIELPQEIIELVEKRKLARENKDWQESDRLRDEIIAKGYQVKDTKQGMEVSR